MKTLSPFKTPSEAEAAMQAAKSFLDAQRRARRTLGCAYVGGLRYLLVTEPGSGEYVTRYSAGEMGEIFTLEQIQALDRGETVEDRGARFTDMVIAARAPLVA